MDIIDISLTLDATLPVWPGDPPIQVSRFLSFARGDSVNASRLQCSAHTGTHIDAPLHHFADGVAADQIRLELLVGPALVIDCRTDAALTADALAAAGVPEGTTRLLVRTANSETWGKADRDRFRETFTAVTEDGAQWLVSRGVRLIGVDYLSVEAYGATTVHRTLLGAGTIILEGLDLRGVDAGPYQLLCLPLKLGAADGAPARAVLIRES